MPELKPVLSLNINSGRSKQFIIYVRRADQRGVINLNNVSLFIEYFLRILRVAQHFVVIVVLKLKLKLKLKSKAINHEGRKGGEG